MNESTEMLWCRLCEKRYPAGERFCPIDTEELVEIPVAAPQGGDNREDPDQQRAVCWSCGTAATDATNTTCAQCHQSLVPPALVIGFPHGSVVVQAREKTAELGRAGTYGHVFAPYPNVSRWHATVGVDSDGKAWVTPNPAAPNGTFVNDEEISRRTPVGPGDLIRFAADRGVNIGPVSDFIRYPQQEPPNEQD